MYFIVHTPTASFYSLNSDEPDMVELCQEIQLGRMGTNGTLTFTTAARTSICIPPDILCQSVLEVVHDDRPPPPVGGILWGDNRFRRD